MLDEALAQLAVYPRDPYLQYVALQLARRENRVEAVSQQVALIVDPDAQDPDPGAEAAARRERVDLFSLSSGALAVQESLQLDTLRGPPPNAKADPAKDERRRETVEVGKLTGPTVKSHPWEQLLAGRKPEVGPLARAVPEDFYFVEFHSPSKALELLDAGDLWAGHLFNQAAREARTRRVGDRILKQLVVETNRPLRPVYDAAVETVAVTSSDLFLAEGSDVTLLFRAKQP